jgi:hypothetical protein
MNAWADAIDRAAARVFERAGRTGVERTVLAVPMAVMDAIDGDLPIASWTDPDWNWGRSYGAYDRGFGRIVVGCIPPGDVGFREDAVIGWRELDDVTTAEPVIVVEVPR